jgi:hypothetical protein
MIARTLSLLLVLSLAVSTAFTQSSKKQTTIYGEVVDLVNYVANGMKPDTPDRKAAAEASARGGNPLAILERGTGRLYVVTMSQSNTGPNETLLPYLGLRIFAVGKAYRKGELRLFILSDIGKSVK